MSHIEFVLDAPDITKGEAAARPKIIYLAGSRYARIEQFADAISDIKHLIIVNEPDIWLVDAVRNIIGHSVNRGTDLAVHNPILGPEGPKELLGFEYGHEVDFFVKAHADRLPPRQNGTVMCDVSQISADDYRITLYQNQSTALPTEINVTKGGADFLKIRYLTYRTNLPFQPSLFRPPEGLKLIEPDE